MKLIIIVPKRRKTMKATNKTTELKARKLILSTLWIFTMFNNE